MESTITFTLNGKKQTLTTEPNRSLLEVLREDLQLTGTKYGCGEGQCRACSVLINGESVPSCTTSVADVNGQVVRTIEGLGQGDELHPVQLAFLESGASQCGYCTAGMIISVVSLFERPTRPPVEEVRKQMQKHICRCCNYVKIDDAIHKSLRMRVTGRGH